ncbi:MAG: hypothetical protein AAF367_03445 [Pseudomonadota bacterium]
MTIMLLSTLLPTAVHLFFAVFALAFIDTPYRAWVSGWLNEAAGADEWGNRFVVSAYLTAWAVLSLLVVWIGVEGLFTWLNSLWVVLGFAEANDQQPLWSSLFRAAAFLVELLQS